MVWCGHGGGCGGGRSSSDGNHRTGVYLCISHLRDARRLPTGKNYAPERTRLESVAGFNTAECNAEPPPGVRALLITLNPAPGKFNELPLLSSHQPFAALPHHSTLHYTYPHRFPHTTTPTFPTSLPPPIHSLPSPPSPLLLISLLYAPLSNPHLLITVSSIPPHPPTQIHLPTTNCHEQHMNIHISYNSQWLQRHQQVHHISRTLSFTHKNSSFPRVHQPSPISSHHCISLQLLLLQVLSTGGTITPSHLITHMLARSLARSIRPIVRAQLPVCLPAYLYGFIVVVVSVTSLCQSHPITSTSTSIAVACT